jgi:hypothetical protein
MSALGHKRQTETLHALWHVRFAPESGHPIFHAALDGCTEFELTHWTGQQLATTYVNRCSQVKGDTLIRG